MNRQVFNRYHPAKVRRRIHANQIQTNNDLVLHPPVDKCMFANFQDVHINRIETLIF